MPDSTAKRQLDAVSAQVPSWTGQAGGGGNFFHQLAGSPDLPESLKSDVAQNAALASEAYAEFDRSWATSCCHAAATATGSREPRPRPAPGLAGPPLS